jgi:hypothetical protein
MLRKSADDMYYIDHDIVADHLAAHLLAKHWQKYSDQFNSTIGQDVWVFAAKLIPEKQTSDFLECIINHDVLLATRCAVAMGEDYYPQVEAQLFKDNESESYLTAVIAMSAMAVLKSDNCIQKLSDNLSTANRELHYFAQRGLAVAGIPGFLEHCITENENWKAAGVGLSGGTYDMWFMGPPVIITDIARKKLQQRLEDTQQPMPIALETIESFGDKSDIENVQKILFDTGNASEFYSATKCLLSLDRKLAISLLVKISSNFGTEALSLYAVKALCELGEKVDVTAIFSYFLTINTKNVKNPTAVNIIVNLLKKHTLPPKAENDLATALTSTDLHQFDYIWEIATSHHLKSFDSLAWKALEGDNIEQMYAAIKYTNEYFTLVSERAEHLPSQGKWCQKSEYLEHFLPAWWSVRMTDGTDLRGCFSSAKPHHYTNLRGADSGGCPYGHANAVFWGENQLE